MIKPGMLDQIREFFGDEEIDIDWLLNHISITFGECNKVTITIDDMNEQEYKWLKEEI